MLKRSPLIMTALIQASLLMIYSSLSLGNNLDSQTPPTSKLVTPGTRSIYLNGVDISSARNQDLRNVHVHVDGDGNVFVKAPHYQVTEEETFVPLSSYKHSQSAPEHQPMVERNSAPRQVTPAAASDSNSALASPVPVGDANPASRPMMAQPDQPAQAKPPKL
jgi:hypothetical protein